MQFHFLFRHRKLHVVDGSDVAKSADSCPVVCPGLGLFLIDDYHVSLQLATVCYRFGVNVVPRRPPATFWELCQEALEDEMLRVLIVAGVISLVIGVLTEHAETGWIEGFAILLAGMEIMIIIELFLKPHSH